MAEAAQPTREELQQILARAQEAGHLPEGFVEAELAVLRAATGEQARAAAHVDGKKELSPEVLAECLQGLEADYKRGIVVIDDEGTVDNFRAALKQDKTAGTSWEQAHARLLANGSVLLKKAAGMQGKGTLIGIYVNGELCIKDRGNEPVIFGTIEDRKVTITTDTPNRANIMKEVHDEGQFANYWEICNAVHADGFMLPPDSPNYKKKAIVAATEAVTGADFVRSASGKEWRSAILDCGDVQQSASVRVVSFNPVRGRANVYYDNPLNRFGNRGAVRVLRG